MKTFQDLGLPQKLQAALSHMKFTCPTPIQAQAIPVALTGRDLIGCAQTGTGKTAAFSIPMVAELLQNPGRTALVLVPTRELAAQVGEVVQQLTRFLPQMKHALLIGGVSMQPQTRALSRSPRIIVATPGRLLDHLRRRSMTLSRAEMLVLDEADRMLDMGFAPQLAEIFRFLPQKRQTLLFSATLPPDILAMSRTLLKDPAQVMVNPPSQVVPKIEQRAIEVKQNEKNEALLDELNSRSGSVLVFARTQSRTDRLARYLESYGVSVARIHGGRTQGQRNRALNGFREGEFRVLVATDIAARGIDVTHVAHVVNYDLPQSPEDYVHRIGRTGRAGASGQALSLVTPEDRKQWRLISRLVSSSKSNSDRSQAEKAAISTGFKAPKGARYPAAPHSVSQGRRSATHAARR